MRMLGLLYHASYLSTYLLLATRHVVRSRETRFDEETTTGLESRQAPSVAEASNFMRRARQASSTTLSIDLSKDWANDTVVLRSISKPPDAPNLYCSSLWYDERNDVFYSGITGQASILGDAPDPPPLSLWSFKPDGTGDGSWQEEIGPNSSIWNRLKRSVWGYMASGTDVALVLDGIANSKTTPDTAREITVPGLVVFNMTTKTITNTSASGFNGIKGPAQHGSMHFVPSFGPNGLFLVMGGSNGSVSAPFNEIWVYEAVTNAWYSQSTTGDIPIPRSEFCLAGLSSTDETYEIFLYGGWSADGGYQAVPYDEIFVLTLPAFRWFKINAPTQSPRRGHSCNAVGGSQIISIGGINPSDELPQPRSRIEVQESAYNSSDPFAQGLGIFDMETLSWADHYRANAPPYVQSDLVRAFYRDSPQDGSQLSDVALQNLFQTKNFDSSPPSTLGPSANSTTGTESSSSNTASIVGGAVGGTVGLVALAGIGLFFYRRGKRQKTVDDEQSSKEIDVRKQPYIGHPLVEADGDAEYKGAQLDSETIHEMRQEPVGETKVISELEAVDPRRPKSKN
ncbi:MAG: hypothetical protein Q9216_000089 [Gyalolechia sp. 2 TL-2023]